MVIKNVCAIGHRRPNNELPRMITQNLNSPLFSLAIFRATAMDSIDILQPNHLPLASSGIGYSGE